MTPSLSPITKRRQIIENAVCAALGVKGAWKNVAVRYTEDEFNREREYLLSKGVLEENLLSFSPSALIEGELENESSLPMLLLVHFSHENIIGSYSNFLNMLHDLRNLPCQAARVVVVETDIPGFSAKIPYGPTDKTVKQIYLEVLALLEKGIADYIPFHEQLLKEVKEENYEKRLAWICHSEKIEACRDALQPLMQQAVLRLLADEHASRSFEAGFIAGDEEELQCLQRTLAPGKDWDTFVEQFPLKPETSLFLTPMITEKSAGLEVPRLRCQIWEELEKTAGRLLDQRCGKAFNRLSAAEKFKMTGDTKFENSIENQKSDIPEININSNFRRFEVSSNPLAALMGGGASASPLGSLGNMGSSLAQTPKTHKLNEYGETFLALLAGWLRDRIYVGGALNEYAYTNLNGDRVLGTIIVLAEDEHLLKVASKCASAMQLGDKAAESDERIALDAFFQFNKNYIRFYEKVRAQLSPIKDGELGQFLEADYSLPKDKNERPEFSDDRVTKKERSKLSQQQAKDRHEAYLKSLRESRKGSTKDDDVVSLDSTTQNVESVAKEVELTEELLEQQELLEEKRLSLEKHLDEQKQRKLELEAARVRMREEQERRKILLEEMIKRRREQEKVERQKRIEKLAEEKRKREEVRLRRMDSLRAAFDQAAASAQKKTENKLTQTKKPQGGDRKKKKTVNPDAVKMMLRFGTDISAISARTGLTEEQVEELRLEVAREDGKA